MLVHGIQAERTRGEASGGGDAAEKRSEPVEEDEVEEAVRGGGAPMAIGGGLPPIDM